MLSEDFSGSTRLWDGHFSKQEGISVVRPRMLKTLELSNLNLGSADEEDMSPARPPVVSFPIVESMKPF